jgi:hypothetical protein
MCPHCAFAKHWSYGALFIAVFLVFAQSLHAEDRETAAVIARIREAAGFKALQRQSVEFVVRGKTVRYESAGEYSIRFTTAGKFIFHVAGPIAETVGFDGSDCWAVDMTGMPRRLELFDRDYHLLLIGLSTGHWLAQLDAADLARAPGGQNQDNVALTVSEGRFKGMLRVDRQLWLPRAFERTGVTGAETWLFDDYRDDPGWKMPGKVTVKREGSTDQVYQVESIDQVPVTQASSPSYAPITARAKDVSFARVVSPRLEAKRASTGHLLVRAKVDDVDLGWFIFDTGAGSSTVLDPSAVARLKLQRLGSNSITSMMGNARTTIMRGRTLEIGPVTLEKPFIIEMDLGFVRKVMGIEVVGIIGYDLLSRCVAELALASDSISVHDPSEYRLDSAHWQRLTLNQALPTVEASFEGNRKGRFRIDVGAAGLAGSVLYHAPAVEELQLLKDRHSTTAQAGPNRIAVGKMAWFELADHRFENVTVLFALDRQGPMADEYVMGNLGVEMLKPFLVVLDYPHERIAFLKRDPNRH